MPVRSARLYEVHACAKCTPVGSCQTSIASCAEDARYVIRGAQPHAQAAGRAYMLLTTQPHR
eukprot:261014-Chlamydomonas_euryale.AAC.3